MIIGNIDDRGRLKATRGRRCRSPPASRRKRSWTVLKIIQTFHPPGVAARDLRECLMLQLERAGRENTLEYRIVRDFMEALGKRKMPEIARGLGLTVDQVQDGGGAHRPPGAASGPGFSAGRRPLYLCRKFSCNKVGDDYVVTTNNEQIPHLRISNHYKDLMAAGRRAAGGAGIHPGQNPGGEISDQEPAATAADHSEHRQRDRQTAAGVHGKRRGAPQADDDGAGGRSGGRA